MDAVPDTDPEHEMDPVSDMEPARSRNSKWKRTCLRYDLSVPFIFPSLSLPLSLYHVPSIFCPLSFCPLVDIESDWNVMAGSPRNVPRTRLKCDNVAAAAALMALSGEEMCCRNGSAYPAV